MTKQEISAMQLYDQIYGKGYCGGCWYIRKDAIGTPKAFRGLVVEEFLQVSNGSSEFSCVRVRLKSVKNVTPWVPPSDLVYLVEDGEV